MQKKWSKKVIVPFDYLVILDFEATCDNGTKPKVTRENQEIIEFPWVVLRLSDNKIIYKDQYFVRPVLTTELTAFCSELTGITTKQIQSAPLLQDVLQKFDEFLTLLESDQIPSSQDKETKEEKKKETTHYDEQEKHEEGQMKTEKQKKKKYCFSCDGEWDIKSMLLAESKRKNFTLNDAWYQYFNIREEFRKKYSGFEKDKVSLKRMLAHLKLDFIGSHHCGLDDCMNVAAICQKMISQGHKFLNPEIIDRTYDPTTDKEIKDYCLSGPAPFSIPTEPTEVLRLRGLPWKATIKDVKNFFAPIFVQSAGVNFFLDKLGRPSGEGCVVFSSITDAQSAILKNGNKMQGRYIELFPCTLEQIKIIADVLAKS